MKPTPQVIKKSVQLTIHSKEYISITLDFYEDETFKITQGEQSIEVDADQVYKFLKFIYGE